jgi:plastocyanin
MAQATNPTVTVQVFQFTPSPVTVKAGTTVTWVNRDDIQHTVTAGVPESPTGKFDLKLAGGGATASATFAEAGAYPYFCARHRSMRGEIRVN